MEALKLYAAAPAAVAARLAGCERLDPRGCTTPQDIVRMAENGQCFEVEAEQGGAVYIVRMVGNTALIDAARGAGWILRKELPHDPIH